MKLSTFGEKFTRSSGIVELMDDRSYLAYFVLLSSRRASASCTRQCGGSASIHYRRRHHHRRKPRAGVSLGIKERTFLAAREKAIGAAVGVGRAVERAVAECKADALGSPSGRESDLRVPREQRLQSLP